MRRSTAILMTVLAGIVVAACGADGASELATTTTIASPSPTTSSSTPSTPGSSTTTTTAAPAESSVPDPEVSGVGSLVAGHNRLDERRIDLVFARHGFPDDVDWIEYARGLLGWDGPVAVDYGGPDGSLSFGLFAIEPYRSNRDLFNVWYLEEPAPSPTAYGVEGQEPSVELGTTLVVTLAWEWPNGVAVAAPPAFEPPELPEPGTDVFRGLVLSVDSTDPTDRDETLAHEMGHAVFALADKYAYDQFGYDDRPNWSFYPACATDRAQAEEWFGDLFGTVPDAFDDFVAAYEDAGIPLSEDDVAYLADLVTVYFIPNGCFGPEGVAVRSSKRGLMYDERELPVMDPVNRRWAEQVLAAWSG